MRDGVTTVTAPCHRPRKRSRNSYGRPIRSDPRRNVPLEAESPGPRALFSADPLPGEKPGIEAGLECLAQESLVLASVEARWSSKSKLSPAQKRRLPRREDVPRREFRGVSNFKFDPHFSPDPTRTSFRPSRGSARILCAPSRREAGSSIYAFSL
ncbi:hypothetical protein KM043_005399 [Ampulex compressa]|nr:hypothetical protein KM043_005399 [Ampulex compressa]